jgi:octaheme c-type cytochrome (tetrathionate reductase family)
MFKLPIIGIVITLLIGTSFFLTKSNSSESNHSDRISGPFNSPKEVTAACIECHTDEAADFMKTQHWNWLGEKFTYKGKEIRFGKKNMISNFFISTISNEENCNGCHAGFGWKDNSFDFTKDVNIDCLVCHDQTGTYKKHSFNDSSAKSMDLLKIAQSAGKPQKENCVNCHLNCGDGLGGKHGDLDASIFSKDENADVHSVGKGMNCIDCHKSEKHNIKGAGHSAMIENKNHISCTNCHNTSEKIHKNPLLNKHIDNIACQTCHIPAYARNYPTLTEWDWSTAGQKDDEKDSEGNVTYSKTKGSLKWERNVTPEYKWFDGGADYYMSGDKIDPTTKVAINTMRGDISDKNSKIYPFKVLKTKQIFDKKFNYLIIPNLAGKNGYWSTFDWNTAAKNGMESAKLEYSGEFGFIETEMSQTLNHSVTKSENAVKCNDCHGKGTRLNWEKLGYTGDPMKKGGRVKNKMLK